MLVQMRQYRYKNLTHVTTNHFLSHLRWKQFIINTILSNDEYKHSFSLSFKCCFILDVLLVEFELKKKNLLV